MKTKQDSFELDDDAMFAPTYVQATPLNKKQLKSMTLLDKLEKLIQLARGCMLEEKFFKCHKASRSPEVSCPEVKRYCSLILNTYLTGNIFLTETFFFPLVEKFSLWFYK